MGLRSTVISLRSRDSSFASIAATTLLLAILTTTNSHAQEAREIEHQGVKRSYILVNASAAKANPLPLWVILHGRRDTSLPNRSSPMLDQLAAKESFIAAYPAGIGGRWHYPQQPPLTKEIKASDGSLHIVPDPDAQTFDDVAFVLAVIGRLIDDKAADPKRIYVSGASNGGLLTFGLMCLAADRIAAAAPLIANMSEAQIVACKPSRPVPAVFVAGTADRVMPYDGMLHPTGHRLTSIPETLEFWRKLHGCSAQVVFRPQPTWSRVDWVYCNAASPSSKPLTLYRIEGGGHTLPSLAPQTSEDLMRNGPRIAAFETSEVVWDYLKQWSLP